MRGWTPTSDKESDRALFIIDVILLAPVVALVYRFRHDMWVAVLVTIDILLVGLGSFFMLRYREGERDWPLHQQALFGSLELLVANLAVIAVALALKFGGLIVSFVHRLLSR